MFEHLHPYSRIIVTGAHRSGTTICSEMIAHDLGYRSVREAELAEPRYPGDTEPPLYTDKVIQWLHANECVTLQAATLFRELGLLQFVPETALVFVWRKAEDCLASQMRYRGRHLDEPRKKHSQFAKANYPHSFVITYDELKKHPLFVHDRAGWAPRQTK